MSITGIQAGSSSMMGMQKPPSPDELASQMVSAVEEGSIDAETLVANLTSRFGDDASAVLAEDGSIDVDELTTLLANNAPGSGGETQGMAPPPPPPPQGMVSSEELQLALTEEFGEEAVASIFEDDGTVNFDELISLFQSQDSSSSSSTTGILLNTTA
ncbi:hypothetical protein Q4508_11685 [Amphritea sp. 2_MG-2023]|uniref:hypothetical protein n=1 Tax=Amphritea TaxID=515417 RepID=UPI001C0787DE|nr:MULTISPECIES: hypothetical protein [Amphritea]MBU2963875.1 hypothetical protein [Amphritea atlantica]MDO6419212.1 hypothetical protein [Amphritea sp. 2_MG-2023]MDX2422912.1 hypothetical protein [Amphritea sp.]